MVAPIITLAIAGGVVFLAFKTSTLETGMEEAPPVPVEAPAEVTPADDEPADEPEESE